MKFQLMPFAALLFYFFILFKFYEADYPFFKRMILMISATLKPDSNKATY